MSTALTRSLAARYYTDPKVYEIEMAGLFARTWQVAGHASQLSEPGIFSPLRWRAKACLPSRGAMG